jgi:hypothetical protein
MKSSLHCRTSNSPLNSLDSSIICQVRNSQSSSLLKLPTISLPSLLNSSDKYSVPKIISRQAGVSKLNSILILAAWDPWGRTHRKHRFLYCCVLIHCCRDVFTAQLHSNERGAEPQRTPLTTPLLLLRDVTAYVTRSSATCVRAIT